MTRYKERLKPLTVSECKAYYDFLLEEQIQCGSILSNGLENYLVIDANYDRYENNYLYGLIVVPLNKRLKSESCCTMTIDIVFIKERELHRIESKINIDKLLKQIKQEYSICDEDIKCFIKMLEIVRDFKEHNLYFVGGGIQRLVLITKMKEDIGKIEILPVFLSIMNYNREKYEELLLEHTQNFVVAELEEFIIDMKLDRWTKIDEIKNIGEQDIDGFCIKMKLCQMKR